MASEKFGITGNGKVLFSESDIGDYSSANIESSAQTQIPNHESQTGKETEVVEYKEGIVDIPKETIDALAETNSAQGYFTKNTPFAMNRAG